MIKNHVIIKAKIKDINYLYIEKRSKIVKTSTYIIKQDIKLREADTQGE